MWLRGRRQRPRRRRLDFARQDAARVFVATPRAERLRFRHVRVPVNTTLPDPVVGMTGQCAEADRRCERNGIPVIDKTPFRRI